VSDKNQNPWTVVARYLSLAMLLPASSLVGYAIGYGLDHVFGTNFLRTVFLLLGTVGGFIQFIRGMTKE
jgi:F0F1-type ATP synthase assembly protein I